MKTIIAIVGVGIVVFGCSILAGAVGPEIAKGVDRYCTELTESERDIVRTELNGQLAPHTVHIHCSGETEDTANANGEVQRGPKATSAELRRLCASYENYCGTSESGKGSTGSRSQAYASERTGQQITLSRTAVAVPHVRSPSLRLSYIHGVVTL